MSSHSVSKSNLPTIAIVGRANVGKSSLWNRLIEQKRAIISAEPHTTRDRNIAEANWRGQQFNVIDTGGYDTDDDEIGHGIRRQAERAVADADVIFFLVDSKTGVIADDRELAKILRKGRERVIVLVNKVDAPRDLVRASEAGAESLGFGSPLYVSAATGSGVGDALDAAYEKMVWPEGSHESRVTSHESEDEDESEMIDLDLDPTSHFPLPTPPSLLSTPQPGHHRPRDPNAPLRIVLIGRPNVGKSSLVNAILGEERVIASAVAHTTREPQDTELIYDGRPVILVDTAGMRRRSNIKGRLEEESIERNNLALDRADVGVLVLDATEPISGQDKLLAGMIADAGKGLILVLNKWDLVPEKTTDSAKEAEVRLRRILPFISWAPIIFSSAKTTRNAKEVLDAAMKITEERRREIAYNAINKTLKSVIQAKRPLQRLGPKSPYIYDIAQTRIEPPTFLLTVRGQKIALAPAWMKFLERRIREQYGFEGTPIVVKAVIVPMAKIEKEHNVRGPGMEGVTEFGKKENGKWKMENGNEKLGKEKGRLAKAKERKKKLRKKKRPSGKSRGGKMQRR
jgi:GTP-binding protein